MNNTILRLKTQSNVLSSSLPELSSTVFFPSSCDTLETKKANRMEKNRFKLGCLYCYSTKRVYDVTKLRRGQHVTMSGESSAIRCFNRYSHHAIVKSCQALNDNMVVLTLIHVCASPEEEIRHPRETTEIYDLVSDEIQIVNYIYTTFPEDIVISRAEEKKMKPFKYNVRTANCEHFCHWCCIGQWESRQATDLMENAPKTCLGLMSFLGVSPYITVIPQLANFVYELKVLKTKFKDGKICQVCFRQKRQYLLLRLIIQMIAIGTGVKCTSQASVIFRRLLNVVPCLVLFFEKLGIFLSSIRKTKMTSLGLLQPGDVISFENFNFWEYDFIVTAVDSEDNQMGKIECICYSLTSYLRKGIVVQKSIQVDLKKQAIFRHEFEGCETYAPEIVVERAKMRLGEQKYGLFSNERLYFCHWAKVKENGMTANVESAQIVYKRAIPKDDLPEDLKWINSRHSRIRSCALFRESKSVKIRNEITKGQVVSFKDKDKMFWHKAISTKIIFDDNCPAKFQLTVIHNGKSSTISEDTFPFDLRNQEIWVDVFHPINRFRKEDIVRRAKASLLRYNNNILYNKSCHFADEVAMNNAVQAVTNLLDLNPGNAVRFYRESDKKDACDAIVANIQSCDVTVIHYNFDKSSKTMTVQKEIININTFEGAMFLLDFTGYATYSLGTVVKRAESRIGEQRFNNRENTSRDFVFWSKVVQIPSIVNFSGTEIYAMEWLLLPTFHKDLQKITVQSWCDLEVGDIVEYQYYWIRHRGILSEIHEEKNEISVIHYGARHLFATRTIMKEAISLNLKIQTLQIYKANPLKANSRGRVVLLARERVGEKKWGFGNTSWNFCLNCVFKNMHSNHWWEDVYNNIWF